MAFILICIICRIFFYITAPTEIIDKIFSVKFNNPPRVDNIVFRFINYFLLLGILGLLISTVSNSRFNERVKKIIENALVKFSRMLNLNVLLIVSLIYLAVLFFLAVTRYDLGFDEAWYIVWSKNFASTGIAYYSYDGITGLIDTITMLPYYILSILNFKLGLTEVWHFKLLGSVLSLISLFVFYRISSTLYDKSTAILFVFFLILQPGFGFLASSFFGEVLQGAFMFYGLFVWFGKDENINKRKIILTSLLFAIAIHTKFQLMMILPAAFVVLYFANKKTKALNVAAYTIIFAFIIILIRLIPVMAKDVSLARNLLIVDMLAGISANTYSLQGILEKFQLYNRFFPLLAFTGISFVFFFYMKSAFEKFIFIFTLISTFWWIFLYPYSTYRHPFIGIITLSIMLAIIIKKFSEQYLRNGKIVPFKFVSAIALLLIMLYGFSTNLIYAYIGYNDGVQFDLSGVKSRSFGEIKYDGSQKEFYAGVKKLISPHDTLYGSTFVSEVYTGMPIFTKVKLIESFSDECFVLITRETYPLDIQQGHNFIDSISAEKTLLLKAGKNELYKIKKRK
ncbi:MAG: hypothetical protein L0Y77_09525 [Chlorobi bacterium]|nr:hypothetical protein [Chlorobiota bacterium]